MKKISTKQAQKITELAKIKKERGNYCIICSMYCHEPDLMHLLPKSVYPKYYTEPLNLWPAHRVCHDYYDESKQFRSQQKRIIDVVRHFATKEEIFRYFGI